MAQRSISGLAAAAGGAALLCAFGTGYYLAALNYPEEKQHQPYRYAADKPSEIDPALSLTVGAKPQKFRSPCDNPKGRDESDFCAQWRAAMAAEDSAFWAKWSFWIGLGGIIGLFWTLYYTRKAVEDTGAATEAMNESNNMMRRQMRRELLKTRPIVSVAPGAHFRPVEEKLLNSMTDENRARCCSFSCTIENTGKADCWLVDSWIKFEYVTSEREDGGQETQFTSFRMVANVPLSAGESLDVANQLYLLPLDIKEKVYAGQGYFKGYCVYRDNDTSTTFGATFGYDMNVVGNTVVARNRTRDRLDWQDGMVRSVELERYGHIHFMSG